MIIDYIGQELIWNLTATHPYKQNRGNYIIGINCKTPKQNKDAVHFLKSHLGNALLTVETRKYIDKNTGLECVLVNTISVPDAFGGFGEVIFINEFAREIKGV
jgi:hypothetical protein